MKKDKTARIKHLIGIDEVGRGPLAGPVTVCACLVPFVGDKKSRVLVSSLAMGIKIKKLGVKKLTDSKGLKESDREEWNKAIRNSRNSSESHGAESQSIYFSIKNASAKQIDKKGIAVCIRKLLNDCLNDLRSKYAIDPTECLVLLDGGLRAPAEFINQETHIKGDTLFPVISFASILAKVHRDGYMKKIAKRQSVYSRYGFEIHKGYGTTGHRQAIMKHGLSDIHRRSFCRNF
jgi:ribonuclease HII